VNQGSPTTAWALSLCQALSLALAAFFIALKKSKIRNRAKASLMAMKAASVNSAKWGQQKWLRKPSTPLLL